MKKLCSLLLLLTAISGFAQLRTISANIQNMDLYPVDQKTFFAFDSDRFYIYKDKQEDDFAIQSYSTDTIKWPADFYLVRGGSFLEPHRTPVKFFDPSHGVAIGRNGGANGKIVLLHTTDGGYHWQLLHALSDTLGFTVQSLALASKNLYLLTTEKGVYKISQGNLEKLDFDHSGGYFVASYQDGYFVLANRYDNMLYASTDATNWKEYDLPHDGGFHRQHFVSNGILYAHHETGVFLPPNQTHGFLSSISLSNHTVEVDTIPMFLTFLPDRKGRLFFWSSHYHSEPVPYVQHTLYLWLGDSLLMKTSAVAKPSQHFVRNLYQGLAGSMFQWEDGTLSYFDHPDCDHLEIHNAVQEDDKITFTLSASGPIFPINYPGAVTMDPVTGDTVSTHCCWYQFNDGQSLNMEGKKITSPTSNQLIVLLSERFKKESYCVLEATLTTLNHLKETNDANESLHVYPNPAQEYLILPQLPENTQISIYDAIGHQQGSYKTSRSDESLDLGDLMPGPYTICVTFVDGKQLKTKFIKTK